jgi:hypothetical protein
MFRSRRSVTRRWLDEAVLDLRTTRLVARLVWRLWTTGAAPAGIRLGRR